MRNFDKKVVATAAILGALTIVIGAFGAHGLKELVDANALASFETAVRYQMFHVLALLILGFAQTLSPATRKWVFWFFILGMVFFSGSIYFLALNSLLNLDTSVLGPVTPIGGIFFIAGWCRLAYGAITLK
jgi:uncharacterized membrane protein YgdD (TMEM256/DUF423 family)